MEEGGFGERLEVGLGWFELGLVLPFLGLDCGSGFGELQLWLAGTEEEDRERRCLVTSLRLIWKTYYIEGS